MLSPSNRLTLIDALRPPPDHSFDAAAAVTYTLDLRAMLSAPAAFALASTSDLGGDDAAEPVELLHAIRSHADRLTVFAQAGQIALPPSRRVFAFLEDSVVSVTAPGGGIVHPKVWLARYVDAGGRQRHRVLIGSRNLTFDNSWDTMLRLDETGDGSGIQLPELARLLEAMLDRAVGPIEPNHVHRVEELAASLGSVRFAPPAGVEHLELHVLGLDGRNSRPFPEQADRSMVISPFLSTDFFTGVLQNGPDVLVSRPESLDELDPIALAAIGSAFVFDDGSTPDVEDDAWELDDPARPLRGMHAKVFAFESGATATVFVGSANASDRAFGRNVEVLAELRGSSDVLGLDALCGRGSEDADEIGLDRLFQVYIRTEEESVDREPSAALETARLQLGALPITATVSGDDHAWAVTYESSRNVQLPDGVHASCWPLTVEGHRKDLVSGERLSHRFDLSLEAISAFLAVEVRADDVASRFVIPTELVGVPDRRNQELLRLMIGNADRFLRYLMTLLADDPRDLDLLAAVDRATTDGERTAGSHGAGLPVLESMLKSLRSDPARLLSIDPLVRDLARTDDGLPPGFAATWEAIVANAREAMS